MENYRVSSHPNFFMVGVDHQSADVATREKFALADSQISHLIYDYQKEQGNGIMVLSTCNRTEIYAFGSCPRFLIGLFCRHANGTADEFQSIQKILQNREAIEHLLRVGSGLESKILGDFEIIGQIKRSFLFAKDLAATNSFLERLVNIAIQCSKKVKNDTNLSTGAASTAFASVRLVKEFIKTKEEPRVVLLGSGKIGRTACENLVNQTGIKDITIVNRTQTKAERLAHKFNLQCADYEQLPTLANEADVVMVATGANKPTLLANHFIDSKPRLLIDLGMPRNVEHDLYKDENFTVVDVDHLTDITELHKSKRISQIPQAEDIVQEHLEEFFLWLESRKLAPTLSALKRKMEDWKQAELSTLQRKFPDLSTNQAEALADQMLGRITGQFARQLKNGSDINNDLRAIHHIFELDDT